MLQLARNITCVSGAGCTAAPVLSSSTTPSSQPWTTASGPDVGRMRVAKQLPDAQKAFEAQRMNRPNPARKTASDGSINCIALRLRATCMRYICDCSDCLLRMEISHLSAGIVQFR